jgi:toxin CcdB
MAQWDVFTNPSSRMREQIPYVVVLQSDLLAALNTRMVAPLARNAPASPGIPARLMPMLQVGADQLVLLPHEAAPIDARSLRQPVASLREESHRIIDALDTVVSGV